MCRVSKLGHASLDRTYYMGHCRSMVCIGHLVYLGDHFNATVSCLCWMCFYIFFYPNFNMNKIEQVSPKSEVLVGGLEHLLFFHILRIIIPTDELIFFLGQVQTTNQK